MMSFLEEMTTTTSSLGNYSTDWFYLKSVEKAWENNGVDSSEFSLQESVYDASSRDSFVAEGLKGGGNENTYSLIDSTMDLFLDILNETVSSGATRIMVDSYTSSSTTSLPYAIQRTSSETSVLLRTIPTPELPTISSSSRNFILTYCLLFIIGAIGNLSVFISVGSELWRKCHRSRIKVLILHLSLADLFVLFFVIPIEVFWRITIYWNGGNILCKICQFFRAFGLYLSSNIIICISLDRFYVIISPLKVIGGMRRVRNMLILAWLLAIALAAPQSLIYSVHTHPRYKTVEQCDTLGYFDSLEDEILYNMLSVSAMYFVPLVVILFTYVSVLIKVTRRSRQHQNISEYHRRMLQQQHRLQATTGGSGVSSDGLMISSRILLKRTFARGSARRGGGAGTTTGAATTASSMSGGNTVTAIVCTPSTPVSVRGGGETSMSNGGSPAHVSGNNGNTSCTVSGSPTANVTAHRRGSQFLRMSDTANSISRARRKAFFLTMIIITAFVICWTPYVVMTCWYILDWDTAKTFDLRLKEAFFIMAVSNSCLNPLIYGNYMKRCYYGFCAKERPTTIGSDEVRSGGGGGGGGNQRGESCDLHPF